MAYRPLSAVVLAAGEGTRMRSSTPKVLHPLCGRPMLLHVLDTLVALPLERIVVVVGHGAEHVTKTLQEQLATEMPIEFVEQRVQRGTGDAASVALTAFADDRRRDDDVIVLHRRHAAAARPRRSPRSPPSTASPTPPRRCSPPSSTTRRGYGRIVRDDAGRGRPHRRADRRQRRGARDRRGQPVDLLLPPRAPRARAAAAQPRERPGRVLPHRRRSRCCARPATSCVARRRPTTRTETLGVNDRAQLAAAEAAAARAHQRPRGCARASSMIDPAPHLRRRRPSSSSPTCGCCPGTILEGRTVDRRRLGDRARHASSSTRSSARTR